MRWLTRCRLGGTMLAITLMGWLGTVAAFAQRPPEKKLPPYDVSGLEHTRIWVPWVFAFLFAALTVAIAFKNPRRSHQD